MVQNLETGYSNYSAARDAANDLQNSEILWKIVESEYEKLLQKPDWILFLLWEQIAYW
jgi:hypothetical protein